MITYDPFWVTLKKKKFTAYALIKKYNISSSTLSRMRRQAPISTATINNLCEVLGCRVQDVLKFSPGKAE